MRGRRTPGRGLGFVWVSRLDVAKTRPALERAGHRCEHCRGEDDLRVVEGLGQLVVLCVGCSLGGNFRLVLANRRASVIPSRGETV